MEEFFPFDLFLEIGFFSEEIRGNHEAQAERVCQFFGYDTVYEYGSKPIRCHISYPQPNELEPKDQEQGYGGRPLHVDEDGQLKPELFITEIPSIYD